MNINFDHPPFLPKPVFRVPENDKRFDSVRTKLKLAGILYSNEPVMYFQAVLEEAEKFSKMDEKGQVYNVGINEYPAAYMSSFNDIVSAEVKDPYLLDSLRLKCIEKTSIHQLGIALKVLKTMQDKCMKSIAEADIATKKAKLIVNRILFSEFEEANTGRYQHENCE